MIALRWRSAALAACWLVTATAGGQQPAFEAAPSIAGERLAPAPLLKGADFQVTEPVGVERFLGTFDLRSAQGTFRVSGVEMLAVRVRELRAIDELRKLESSTAFTDALAKSASAPVKLVGALVTDPGTTVENVASGAGTVLGRIGYSVKTGVQNAGDAMSKPAEQPKSASGEEPPPAFTGDPLGYNQARREWARKLDVDPYTTNPVLRPLLDNAAKATFAGSFAVNATVGAVAAPLQYASEFDATVRDSAWSQPPVDLAQANESKLQKMGVPAESIRAFLRNRWYTPTLQTALVSALERLDGVQGRDAVVHAASTLAGEVPARFLIRSVALLGDRHRKDGRLTQVRMRGIVPVGQAAGGTLVAAAAADYLFWNADASAFAQAKELSAPKRVLLLAGDLSPRATSEFTRLGWTVQGRLRGMQ